MSTRKNDSLSTPLMKAEDQQLDTTGPAMPSTSQPQNNEPQMLRLGAVKKPSWVDQVDRTVSTDRPTVLNIRPEAELEVSRTTSVQSTESLPPSNLPVNDQINNENVNGLKNLGIAGFDIVLLANNATQLFYQYKGNNFVWPWTPQAVLLSLSIVFQVLVLVLIGLDAIFFSNQSRIIIMAVSGLMALIAGVNFVIDWFPF